MQYIKQHNLENSILFDPVGSLLPSWESYAYRKIRKLVIQRPLMQALYRNYMVEEQ